MPTDKRAQGSLCPSMVPPDPERSPLCWTHAGLPARVPLFLKRTAHHQVFVHLERFQEPGNGREGREQAGRVSSRSGRDVEGQGCGAAHIRVSRAGQRCSPSLLCIKSGTLLTLKMRGSERRKALEEDGERRPQPRAVTPTSAEQARPTHGRHRNMMTA